MDTLVKAKVAGWPGAFNIIFGGHRGQQTRGGQEILQRGRRPRGKPFGEVIYVRGCIR